MLEKDHIIYSVNIWNSRPGLVAPRIYCRVNDKLSSFGWEWFQWSSDCVEINGKCITGGDKPNEWKSNWITYLLHWLVQSSWRFLLTLNINGPESHFSTRICWLLLEDISGVWTREKQLAQWECQVAPLEIKLSPSPGIVDSKEEREVAIALITENILLFLFTCKLSIN